MTTILTLALAAALADPPFIERLGGRVQLDRDGQIVAVNLRGTWVNDAEMIDIARLPRLKSLDLSHTRIGDEGLLRLKSAAGINDLNLFYAEWITDQGLTAVRGWKSLKRLNLRGTRISDPTLALISKMPALESLDIANTQVTDNGLDHLITLTNLKELSLGRSRLSENALEVLRMLPSLTYLDLSGARAATPDMDRRRTGTGAMNEATIRALAELKQLRTLRMGFSDITPYGLGELSGLSNVTKLGLEFCAGVNDQAVPELLKWKGLKYLDLQGSSMTPAAIEALKKARPDLTILGKGKP